MGLPPICHWVDASIRLVYPSILPSIQSVYIREINISKLIRISSEISGLTLSCKRGSALIADSAEVNLEDCEIRS